MMTYTEFTALVAKMRAAQNKARAERTRSARTEAIRLQDKVDDLLREMHVSYQGEQHSFFDL